MLRPRARWLICAPAVLWCIGAVFAQTPASPTFEVASVKPNRSGNAQLSELEVLRGGRFRATNVPLKDLILIAYGLREFQLAGGPNWISSERFDIDARADTELTPGAPPPHLRRLLEERFNLKVHKETKELPIYALVVAKSDGTLLPSLRRSPVDYCAEAAQRQAQAQQPSTPPSPNALGHCQFRMGNGTLTAASMPIRTLAGRLASVVNRFVVDRTGLEGVFDFDLKWAPEQSNPDPDGVSIFTALQEQLGLKLESTRGQVDVVVIDHVEPPTEN